ncbi:SDR family NAD(P)-dependent oxidoreductase [Sphingomonas immobilis]|uniref:SDR family oxidoreductase n=1 Tax=Sphingomonas immobilis TaxID=3063997 RepID=A0ABT8ZZG3_9SPHN|nr:SDR family oxidoreductase [Sphingomonas sp. CA1-15]MDO7842136.1 SDR family oxidoreductase [Sphingomonas sp. CA1-15]
MLLQHKSVVITGAGSGVGRAAAVLFAQHGARVVCADINLDWATETARLAGADAVPVLCNVTQRAEVEAAIDLACDRFGRLDVLYNNAGVATASDGRPHRLIDQDDADFDRLMSINLRGMVYGCQAAVRRFDAQGGGGVIVNTASVAGLIGWGGVMYGASKGGVVQLTRALAIEVAKQGIRVNAVCPAGMMTNFGRTEGAGFAERAAEEVARYAEMHPLGRPIAAEDCANAALFLASDLSSNITGVMLPVDGGLTAK